MKNQAILEGKKLKVEQLYRRCDIERFSFDTTGDLETLEHPLIGQDRALAAAEFGIKMERDGYNIYALGPEETDKRDMLEDILNKEASGRNVPCDWCYVCNFKDENKPVALELPSGKASRLRDLMNNLVEDLPNILTSAFESEEYQNRRQTIEEQLKEEEQKAFTALQEEAGKQGFTIISTPLGYTFAPVKDGKMMTIEEIQKLSDKEKASLDEVIQNFQKELQKILRRIPERQRKFRVMRDQLNREFADFSVKGLLEEIESEFQEQNAVKEYLKQVREDIIEHVEEIIRPGAGNPFIQAVTRGQDIKKLTSSSPVLWRYTVNVMVDNEAMNGAPVIYEDNPTYNNLIGRIEHVSEMGALTTDFTHIKPGALLRANGGYLMLDTVRILTQPFAWDGLKRVLLGRKLKIESAGDRYGLISTVTLEPEPIDLDVKVILIGSRLLYYLLCAYDPDFNKLFKVEVDFEDQIDWNTGNQELYARLIAALVHKYKLNPLDKSGVARVIEHASRLVDDHEKLTTHIREIIDLLREADFWARQNGKKVTDGESVQKSIEQQLYRSGRLRDRLQEEILRKTLFIDTEGSRIGQVNGLSVMSIGNVMFGHPTRITARVQLGKGDVVDIEREVEMSGPIHSKGVLILSAFLGARYAMEKPLSLSASLVFEQSYGGVEGDSASSTELYVLLSAIGEIPLKQTIAVTGSVNQHGYIQPIGGVNEKIEGFFDICSKRGLTGEQGVLIPEANIKNLMLKREVVRAVEDQKFHIYPVTTIDEGMEILTDLDMGERNTDGIYPDETINYRVEERLNRFAVIRKQFAATANGKADKQE